MIVRRSVLIRIAALAATLMAAATPAPAAEAQRIVALGGAITEILYAIGLADRIVAVDTTSLYPPEALKEKKNVGYLRALSPEGVIGLSPSLILAAEGAGPPDAINVIRNAGINFAAIPDRFDGEGIVEKIRAVTQRVGEPERGACLIRAIQPSLEALEALRPNVATKRRVMFILSLSNGRVMAAGTHTAADGVIHMASAENALGAMEGYKAVSDEAIIAAKPDAILVMQRPGFAIGADDVFALQALRSTPAGAARAFISMDGQYLLGFGPRTAHAARDLAAQLYPDRISAAPTDKAPACAP